MTPAVPADDYFLEIEAHFAMRRKTPFILSAKDWALMKKWRDDGIPLAIVIEALDQVFEKNESSGRKVISSLSYCRHAVKELWRERKELYVGGAEATPEEQPGPLLEALAARLEASGGPPAVLREIAAAVRRLEGEKTIPRIEERLIELERELMQRILDGDPAAAGEISGEAAAALGDSSKVDEKVRRRTEEANLRRIVRARYELPRLTLFR
ncbi:MAG TPA: hypothetical protein VNA04_05635 [Thermoanaerobaculia bacterium]|nr:hypothetical protein [Thermoanaerobaculia bacterium]